MTASLCETSSAYCDQTGKATGGRPIMPLRVAIASLVLMSLPGFAMAQDDTDHDAVAKPAAISIEGVPIVPAELAANIAPYGEYRTASFQGWHPVDRSILIATRFGNTTQLHVVDRPGGARRQISFAEEPIGNGSYSPGTGNVLLLHKDIGGNENYQIFSLADGRLRLLTDGVSRNGFSAWTDDGNHVAFRSTKRNGRDTDLYIMDPRNPKSARMLAEREGGGWLVLDFTPDGKHALVRREISVTDMELYLIDVATGEERLISREGEPVSFSGLTYAPDGRLWASSDEGSQFKRLGVFDPDRGVFDPIVAEPWDIADFSIAPDGSFIAYVINAGGQTKLKLYDTATGAIREVDLPPGLMGGIEIAPWGEIGFSFNSNQSATDVYSVDPKTLEVKRWTYSEQGGLDPQRNALPDLIEIESFDGERMSGFIYRPDPSRFPGPRPVIVDVHGGPEYQAFAGFLGRYNYLINEMGIAVMFPNVRGSTGYGKRFTALDDGPFKREDAVRDLGVFFEKLEQDPDIDGTRMAVTGGSYGGYMCYAAAIAFGDKLRGADCFVGISSFVTFLENTKDYRRDERRVEFGDERDPEQRRKLIEISPLTRADEIGIPMLVSTGANDPRVPASEATQIVDAIRANGGAPWYLIAGNEGHGFAKKENRDFHFMARVLFYQKHLLE
ncbi:prolyl oligopeptidase family serine peptidase [uncultured Erythrobacter sp.]|uniref:S9 family peptidase n=1 Tax=uncultured Erythrobacter sp. TaxID=263913 RepID=UPI00260D1723|nr:prolyl oligopeptidase family serine peptidase [uncultured Erythrobacter sp.]